MKTYKKKAYPTIEQYLTGVNTDTVLPNSTRSIPPYVTQHKNQQHSIRTNYTNTSDSYPLVHPSTDSGMHIRHKNPTQHPPTRSIELSQQPTGGHTMSHHSNVPPQSSPEKRNQLTNRLHPLPPPSRSDNDIPLSGFSLQLC